MNGDVRDELRAYFERDIGQPPPGARERVLRGLDGRARDRVRAGLRWAWAAVLALLLVAALLGLRAASLAGQTLPAGTGGAPAPRSFAAVGYDAARGALVVFGGTAADGRTALGGTWTWAGGRWRRLSPAASPPATARGLMAFDPVRAELVLYGAAGATWTWDGRTWRSHPGSPPLDDSATMAYDAVSKGVLLYEAPAGGRHQTWRWNGAAWTDLRPPTTPDVVQGLMASDGARVLLTGTPFGLVRGQPLTQTWAWDGADWSLLAPAVRLPGADAMAPGATTGAVLALSGAETWAWDGATWSRLHPAHQPPGRSGGTLAYDARAHEWLLFGGLARGTVALGDLWAWDGHDWRLIEETKR